MNQTSPPYGSDSSFRSNARVARKKKRQRLTRPVAVGLGCLGLLAVLSIVSAGWIALRAQTIKTELTAVTALVGPLKEAISSNDPEAAEHNVGKIREHTEKAKAAADDPIWSLASTLPVVGQNLSAVAALARTADDVAALALEPLAKVYRSLDWDALVPSSSGTDLAPIQEASPAISSAANAVRLSADRLGSVETGNLLPEVKGPLSIAQEQLEDVTDTLDAAADAAHLLPPMLGADTPKRYLLMIQNNAESRSSGGIPGALAILALDKGTLSLSSQSTATALGPTVPPVATDADQVNIYSSRLGKFMQDVNLTPDFPTAAAAAQAIWERKTGTRVDGVVSVDPIALGYILDATGPVTVRDPEVVALAGGKLPTELTGTNVVRTLLSDVYAQIEQPDLQDVYFAGVAQEIFAALANGNPNPKAILAGINRAADEGRVLLWSASTTEQDVLAKYRFSGSIAGPSVPAAQFGVFFNDGTGAKMDYYVKRTVQLIRECPKDGYENTTVRITSTNNAPADAATSLPAYVTGAGIFGVPPGSVQTNIVAYGPVQATVETAHLEGQKTGFAPYLHSNRPLGVLAVWLAPGESKTVEFTFGKIVQHTEPNVVVTPTVQAVKDVTLPTENAACG